MVGISRGSEVPDRFEMAREVEVLGKPGTFQVPRVHQVLLEHRFLQYSRLCRLSSFRMKDKNVIRFHCRSAMFTKFSFHCYAPFFEKYIIFIFLQ